MTGGGAWPDGSRAPEPYRKAHGEGAAMALDQAIEYATQDEA